METDLYPPIKRHLERLGLEVKGEVCGCDLVALSHGSPELVVIGEMKQSFTLELVLQAVDRTSVCDEVWLAVRASKRGGGRENDARVKKLCRFLGFGLLTVTAEGRVDVVAEPAPWKPRRDAKRRSRIVEEHRRRKGDPVAGGSARTPQMTAYRQQALAVANALASTSSRPRDLRILAPDAAKILQGNVYGWFERIERGLYGLTSSGRVALERFPAGLNRAVFPTRWKCDSWGAPNRRRRGMGPLSVDLRKRVVSAVREEGMSCRAAAQRFGVSFSSAIRWVAALRERGSYAPLPMGGDTRSQRVEAHTDFLLRLHRREPDLTLNEICDRLERARGEKVSPSMIWRFFDRHDITFKKSPRTRVSRAARTSLSGDGDGSTVNSISIR